MDIILEFLIGLGLSTACGFRIIIPFLIMNIGSITGFMHPSEQFQWLGTYPALIILIVAVAIEILGTYIPIVDSILEEIKLPCAVIAGTILTSACISDMQPILKWSLAIIAGGSASGIVHFSTTKIREFLSVSTFNVATPVFSTIELITSFILSICAIVLPVLALFLVIILMILLFVITKKIIKKYKKIKANKTKTVN